MQFDQQKKTAFIIGGSSGMGFATVKKLAQHGYSIYTIYHTTKSHDKTAQQEFSALEQKYKTTIQGDVVDAVNFDKNESYRKKLLQKISKQHLNILVFSVSKGNIKPMQGQSNNSLSGDDFLQTIDAMTIAWYKWAEWFFKQNCFAKKALNIAFTSMGSQRIAENYAAVGVAKGALETMGKYMAAAWAKYGIRTNLIQGGITDTPSFRLLPNAEKLLQKISKHNPSGRHTRAEDIANVVYLLALREANWINGACIPVDGGEFLL